MAAATEHARIAFVTGAARGHGLAIARRLAADGAVVYLADIGRDVEGIPYPLSTQDTLDAAVQQVRADGGAAHGVLCDVRDPVAVDAALARVEAEAGAVTVLVNNAGVMALNPLPAVSDAEWAAQMDIIVGGAFHCCRRALPGMNAAGWGRIVNVVSVAGQRGIGTGVAYTAAKHALMGLTRALAMEVANQAITVNAVCPGTAETDLVRGMGVALGVASAEVGTRFAARHLTGRPITSQDVAAAVAWLASEEAARINGAALFVDDGWHAH